MQTRYIGQTKFLVLDGRLFRDTEQAREAITNIEWARDRLSMPNVRFQNGKESHEVANQMIDKAEDTLMDYQVFTAGE